MPWKQLRKLKVWLKDFGLLLESEWSMRQQLTDKMPFAIVADSVLFAVSKESIELCAMVTIPDWLERSTITSISCWPPSNSGMMVPSQREKSG